MFVPYTSSSFLGIFDKPIEFREPHMKILFYFSKQKSLDYFLLETFGCYSTCCFASALIFRFNRAAFAVEVMSKQSVVCGV